MSSEPLRIGLTGGIGSGKSTACKLFQELGVPVIDADQIAHDLTGRNQPAIPLIRDIFGSAAVSRNSGELDRVWLRQQVFNNPELRRKLENLLHPLIYAEINRQVELLDAPYCIIAIPLLHETGGQKHVQRVLVIDVPESVQIERARRRDGMSPSDIQKIMDSQSSRAERLGVANDIIHNDSNIESLRQQVTRLHNEYLHLGSTTSVGKN